MIDSGCLSTMVCTSVPNGEFYKVEAVAANNVALQQYGQKVVHGHVTTNSGRRILIQITLDVMSVRKLLLKKLQLVTDEQSSMQIKLDSLTFLVKARTLHTREPHTDAARMAHDATHVPIIDWCPFCVASRGRTSPHRRVVVNMTTDSQPKFQTDYMFIRTVAESKTQPCITFVETRSGVVVSFMCAREGGYEDLTKEILRHFQVYGFLNPVILPTKRRVSLTCAEKLHANETQEQC